MKLRLPALALSLGLVLAGCGSDDPASDKKAAGPTLDDAQSVVLDYFAKSFVGDEAACKLESEKFTKAMDEQYGNESCAERMGEAKEMLIDGEPPMDPSKTTAKVTEGEDGGAVAEVEHQIEGFGGKYQLVVVNGSWVIDVEVMPLPDGAREVTEDEAIAIEKAWCDSATGMTRAEVEAILGEPTGESTDEDGQPEVEWIINNDYYTVWFDAYDKVTNSSSSTPRETLAC